MATNPKSVNLVPLLKLVGALVAGAMAGAGGHRAIATQEPAPCPVCPAPVAPEVPPAP